LNNGVFKIVVEGNFMPLSDKSRFEEDGKQESIVLTSFFFDSLERKVKFGGSAILL
jgi:hypothetical protein